MGTEVKRDQTEALFAQDFFKRIFVTMSVKQELCQVLKIGVYLDFHREEKFALLSKLIVKRGLLAFLIGETVASMFACQQ